MKKIDLTKGSIAGALLSLSFPIILTNLIQTAYGMIDMIWIGKLGSGAVAAIGTSSFFINLALAIFTLIVIGTGVKLSHSMGEGKEDTRKTYINNGLILSFILATVYILFLLVFKDSLIGFYELNDIEVETMAKSYLVVSGIGIIFMYFNSLLTTIFNSYGNSKMPFRANAIGFLFNIVLDPILIFGFGVFEGLGVTGAALATLFSRGIVFLVFLKYSKGIFKELFNDFRIRWNEAFLVIKLGLPIAAQRVTFTLISITIAKIVADFGATAIAVQKVGVQIESISYITIGGLQGAIAAYTGQNFGMNKLKRIKEGYIRGLAMTVLFGLTISVIFIVFPKEIFGIFLNSPEALEMGANYMRILGLSQVFMCMELFTVGAFNGIGKTFIPPIISIVFSALRIPFAIILSNQALFGLDGIWLSISVSSVFKGVILVILFVINFRNLKEKGDEQVG